MKFIKQWVQWKGGVYFLAILGLMALFVLNFGHEIVKARIEHHVSALFGTLVESSNVKITYNPLSVTVQNLNIYRAKNKDSQLIQIDRIDMLLSWHDLFLNRVIIEEMDLNGIRFNNLNQLQMSKVEPFEPFEPFGAEILPIKFKMNSTETLKFMDLQRLSILPEEEFIISSTNEFENNIKHSLKSTKSILYQINQEIEHYNTNMTELMNQSQNNAHVNSDILQKMEIQDDGVNKTMESLLKSLNRVKFDLNEAILILQSNANQINKSDMYIDSQMKKLLVEQKLLIEKKIKRNLLNFIDVLLHKYATLTKNTNTIGKDPFFNASGIKKRGDTIVFEEYSPQPNFLIRSMNLNFDLEIGSLKGNIHNVTTEQHVLKHPLTFHVYGSKLHEAKDIELEGFSNRIEPQTSSDEINLRIEKFELKNINVLKTQNLNIEITKGSLNTRLKVKLENENTVDIQFFSVTHANDISLGIDDIRIVRQTDLSEPDTELRDFEINVRLLKNSEGFNIDIKSNIDLILYDLLFEKSSSSATLNISDQRNITRLKKYTSELLQSRRDIINLENAATNLFSRINSRDKALAVSAH